MSQKTSNFDCFDYKINYFFKRNTPNDDKRI
jgi:hypothetical protein